MQCQLLWPFLFDCGRRALPPSSSQQEAKSLALTLRLESLSHCAALLYRFVESVRSTEGRGDSVEVRSPLSPNGREGTEAFAPER